MNKLKNGLLFRKLETLYHYSRGTTKLPYPPINIITEITNKCNLRCRMCPQSLNNFRKRGHMPIELYKLIVNNISGFVHCQTLTMGGETLLHPNLIEMIRFSKDKGIRVVSLITNGSLFTKKLSKKIIRSGLDEILISFEGDNKELYEKIRPPAKYENTLESIKLFLRTKKELKSKKPYVTITSLAECIEKEPIHTTFPRITDELTKHFDGLPVDEFRKMWMVDWPVNFKENKSLKFNVPLKEKKNYLPCNKLWTDMQILWDGIVVPCCRDLNADLVLGDVKKDTILDIWNNQKYQYLRKIILDKEYGTVKLCANCSDLFYIKEKKFWKKVKYGMLGILTYLRIINWRFR